MGFAVSVADISGDILVPRYYDPTIGERLDELSETHDLVSVSDLQGQNELSITQGNYIGKMHYGSGLIPYIRTSDLTNWELKGSPKHGVSQTVYLRWSARQDVRPGDILLVHEGTYLIGTSCIVTAHDAHLLFQHHLAKLRILPGSRLTPFLLLALFHAPIVQQQIRAKQLTADTIDSIVGRLPEVVLPVPRDRSAAERLSRAVERAIMARAEGRAKLVKAIKRLEDILTGRIDEDLEAFETTPENGAAILRLLGDTRPFEAFCLQSDQMVGDILVPKYYDPTERSRLDAFSTCEHRTIEDLLNQGVLSLETGHEVGKIHYGSGQVPFVRTSDLGNWELRTDVKQRVSDSVYRRFTHKQRVAPEDIFIVRDGTYLVGSATMVQEEDLPLLFCGGIYRLRVLKREVLDPYLLFALLNLDVIRLQMRNRQFTRDVIDTLGHRLREVVLPIPSDGELREAVTRLCRSIIRDRVEAREALRRMGLAVEMASGLA